VQPAQQALVVRLERAPELVVQPERARAAPLAMVRGARLAEL